MDLYKYKIFARRMQGNIIWIDAPEKQQTKHTHIDSIEPTYINTRTYPQRHMQIKRHVYIGREKDTHTHTWTAI